MSEVLSELSNNNVCNRKCSKSNECHKISQQRQNQIRQNFHSYQPLVKNQFYIENVTFLCNNDKIKGEWQYSLDGNKVCKQFFLNVINLKKSNHIEDVIRKHLNSVISPDKPKHWKQHNEEFVLEIKDFIESKNPQHNHYNLEKVPNRRYIENMNSYKLYELFAKHEIYSAI